MRIRVDVATTGGAGWEVQTFGYSYLLYWAEREIVAYHWEHEGGNRNVVRTPHVHAGKDLPHAGMHPNDRELLESIAAAHLPTGLIPFTDLLTMVIRDFGVEPIRYPGERAELVRERAMRTFEGAEAALRDSFRWWRDE